MRDGGLVEAIKQLGWTINDEGDITKEQLADEIKREIAKDNSKYKYVFQNIEAIGVINKCLHDIVHRRS